MAEIKYTPTQVRILKVLADGLDHPRVELLACLGDELSQAKNLRNHLNLLRKKLRPKGEDIVCVVGKHLRIHYRQVRLLRSVADE